VLDGGPWSLRKKEIWGRIEPLVKTCNCFRLTNKDDNSPSGRSPITDSTFASGVTIREANGCTASGRRLKMGAKRAPRGALQGRQIPRLYFWNSIILFSISDKPRQVKCGDLGGYNVFTSCWGSVCRSVCAQWVAHLWCRVLSNTREKF